MFFIGLVLGIVMGWMIPCPDALKEILEKYIK